MCNPDYAGGIFAHVLALDADRVGKSNKGTTGKPLGKESALGRQLTAIGSTWEERSRARDTERTTMAVYNDWKKWLAEHHELPRRYAGAATRKEKSLAVRVIRVRTYWENMPLRIADPFGALGFTPGRTQRDLDADLDAEARKRARRRKRRETK